MNSLKLYGHYISILIRGQIQYRASFLMTVFGQAVTTFLYFLSTYFMFAYFGHLGDWTYWEVLLCTSCVHIAYPLAECFGRGFDSFQGLIRNGGFDTLLIRPRSILLQVFGSNFAFNRIGRMIQGPVVMVLAIQNSGVEWTAAKGVLYALMVLSGAVAFLAVFMLGATMCFWTVKGLEVINCFSDGGRELSQYPYEIYKKPYLLFFTFVIPYACAFYWPLLYLTGRSTSLWCWAAPVLGMLVLIPAVALFRYGVKRYTSTGS